MDWGSVGAIFALCVAGVLGLYLFAACVLAPLLSRKPKNDDGSQDKASLEQLEEAKLFGATKPGRPAHVIAADAKKYAEAKAALLNDANGSASFPEAAQKTSASILSGVQLDDSRQVGTDSAADKDADYPGHAALDASASEKAY